MLLERMASESETTGHAAAHSHFELQTPAMPDELADVERPPAKPVCTPEEILMGPQIDPLDRIKLYSDDEFEEMIREWAFFYLQDKAGKYKRVQRLGGAGDRGRDVIGYVDPAANPVELDAYQCKHYDHALYPSDLWPELGKFCVMAFRGRIPIPRNYYLVAPQDVGPDLSALLDEPAKLKDALVAEWIDEAKANPLFKKIIRGESHKLEGALAAFVDKFDFRRVSCKPILEVVNELREIPHRYSPRFGGGLIKPLPPDRLPPDEIAAEEQKYVACLVDAYRHHKRDKSVTCETLTGYLHDHFKLSRERYYCAETIKEFSRDTLPEQFTFEDVQTQVYDSVVDTCKRPDHADAYIRVIEVVKVAQSTQIINHPLRSYLKAKSLQGICHQLANEEKLKWVL
jgi:hypothetical protein